MPGKHERPTTFKMGVVLDPDTYDPLKKLALVGLPAFSALYFGLGQIWGWPKIEEVVGSVAVIDTFLGALLGISSANYKKQNEGGYMSTDRAIGLAVGVLVVLILVFVLLRVAG